MRKGWRLRVKYVQPHGLESLLCVSSEFLRDRAETAIHRSAVAARRVLFQPGFSFGNEHGSNLLEFVLSRDVTV